MGSLSSLEWLGIQHASRSFALHGLSWIFIRHVLLANPIWVTIDYFCMKLIHYVHCNIQTILFSYFNLLIKYINLCIHPFLILYNICIFHINTLINVNIHVIRNLPKCTVDLQYIFFMNNEDVVTKHAYCHRYLARPHTSPMTPQYHPPFTTHS